MARCLELYVQFWALSGGRAGCGRAGAARRGKFLLLHIESVVSVKVFGASRTVYCVYETTGKGGLIKQGIVRAEEVVAISYGTVMVDLFQIMGVSFFHVPIHLI